MSSKKKKIVTKDDLRRLMKEKQTTIKYDNTKKKIEHHLAKYNALHQLVCTLCNVPVKSDILWTAHLQSRQHKELLTRAKTPGTDKVTDSSKRKAVDVQVADTSNSKKPKNDSEVKNKLNSLVNDYDDEEEDEEEEEKPDNTHDALPEGFFDDPKLDAKARNVEYVDKMEEEWELFQKTMKEEQHVSENIIEEEDDHLNVERNIDEIEEQMQCWKDVNDLEKKKEKVMKEGPQGNKKGNESDDELDDTDLEEFLDWRTKTSR